MKPDCAGNRCGLGRAIAAAVLIGLASGPASARDDDRVEYNRDVRPILSDNCFACHGPDAAARKADLRLDFREEAVEIGVIVPGSPDESELIFRVESDDEFEVMPPPEAHKTLTDAQKLLLRRWIEQGAEYQPHWAYIPPTLPDVPALDDASLVRNPIDAFVQHELGRRRIGPAPEADRRALIRRLSLDLIGLPPSPEEVRAFVDDPSEGAYEALVDRLLESPHFGERMAEGWLDVARYADTVGFHGDQNQNAWAYRDYVIDAFNANKPFDEFTAEQLAGDLLPEPSTEQLVATCFNRLNMMTREGGAQPKEYLSISTADRIRTVGMAWLGSTFACAECHDHKFDPISARDFYALGAFFADVKQWGVYADYDYTPNPDLRGFNNDYPFPPEIVVESPALIRRLDRLRARLGEAVASAEPDADALASWIREVRGSIEDHPSGWETPTPSAGEGGSVEPDGRIVFEGDKASDAAIELESGAGRLAAIRLELLPDDRHGGKIVRAGDRSTVRAAFELVRDGKKPERIGIRHAQADRRAPRYSRGFEIIGVQSGWATDPAAVGEPHEATFVLDRPLEVEAGDRLRIRLPGNVLAAVRVGTSPIAPLDLQHPGSPAEVAAALDDEATARAAFLRSTAWDPAAFDRVRAIDAEILACRDGKTPVMVTERTDKPLTIRVLPRGNWMDDSGPVVDPATPEFLPGPPDAEGRRLTRLDLARWLCSDENPLTARVFTNRTWERFFGRGLSASVDDLGAQGEPPSHPGLLDWLAVEFRDGGWDVKRMIKLIVMSHAYRQSSDPRPEVRAVDPNNRLLAMQVPRRLEAEAVRDNALAIAGLLDPEPGGPPAKPYQPAGYYGGLQFPDREYQPDADADQWRRGVYMHWQRTFLHPMLANFDAPSREDCIALRTEANSPQQALTLLNDPTFVEAARAFAALLVEQADDDDRRLELAFERALARPISPDERAGLLDLLGRLREHYRAEPDEAGRLLAVGIAPGPGPDADPAELAAWANACRVILNLHETITRD